MIQTLKRGACLAGVLISAGCAQINYDRIHLGDTHQQYDHALPAETARRTDIGLCGLEPSALGRTDATVLVFSHDYRVAAKFFATHIRREWGVTTQVKYRLVGEIDPQLAALGQTPEADMLRAMADSLSRSGAERLIREAHGWVCAGLIRILQSQWSDTDPGPALPRMTDWLERVAPGGSAKVWKSDDGVVHVEYSVSGPTPPLFSWP